MPDFFTLLTSDREDDRRLGVLQLVRERPPEARDLLERAARADPSPQVRYLARRAIAYLDGGRASLVTPPPADDEPTLRWLASGDAHQRVAGLKKALKTGERRAVPLLVPLLDAKDAGTRRAVLAFFARHGHAADLPHLLPLVHDPRPDIRQSGAAALVHCGSSAAVPYVAYLVQDPVADVRSAARSALSRLPRATLLAALDAMSRAREPWQRDSAAWALAHLPGPEAVTILERLVADPVATVRHKAERGLRRAVERGDARAPEPAPPAPVAAVSLAELPRPASPSLADLLNDPNPKLRLTALATALARNDTSLLPALLDRLQHEPNPYVLSRLVIVIGHLGARDTAALLLPYLDHADPRLIASAIESIHRLGYRGVHPRYRAFLAHASSRVQANALFALADDPEVDAGAHLRRMLSAPDAGPKLSGLYVLERRGPRPHGALVELVLGDVSDEVRERAFALLSDWSDAGHADARAMLETCIDGDVAIRRESLKLERAHPVRRVVAFGLDAALIGGATALAVTIALGLGTDVAIGRAGVAAGPSTVAALLALSLGTIAFFVRDALRDGRGLAKGLLGLRVVDLASNRGCGPVQSLVRQAFLWLGPAGPVEMVLMHTDEAGRRMADWMASTQVIAERRRPLALAEWVGGAALYVAALAATAQAVASSVRVDDRYAAAGMGVLVQLPPGWEFGARTPTLVEMRRRTLARGPEMHVKLRAYELRGLLASKPAPLSDEAKRARELLVEELRKAGADVFVKPLGEASLKVLGEPAASFDLAVTRAGRESRVRAVLFRRGARMYELTAMGPEAGRFADLEPELDALIGGLSVD